MAKLTRSGRSVTRRTLERYWEVTTIQGWTFLANVLVTLGYVFFLTFASPLVVGKVVDLVAEGGVGPDRVWEVFGPSTPRHRPRRTVSRVSSPTASPTSWP